MSVRMQIPFDLNDVRFISMDGNTIRFDLTNGHVEVTFDSREVMERVLQPRALALSATRHAMYQDGIYGI
jgi:hypothetical protein